MKFLIVFFAFFCSIIGQLPAVQPISPFVLLNEKLEHSVQSDSFKPNWDQVYTWLDNAGENSDIFEAASEIKNAILSLADYKCRKDNIDALEGVLNSPKLPLNDPGCQRLKAMFDDLADKYRQVCDLAVEDATLSKFQPHGLDQHVGADNFDDFGEEDVMHDAQEYLRAIYDSDDESEFSDDYDPDFVVDPISEQATLNGHIELMDALKKIEIYSAYHGNSPSDWALGDLEFVLASSSKSFQDVQSAPANLIEEVYTNKIVEPCKFFAKSLQESFRLMDLDKRLSDNLLDEQSEIGSLAVPLTRDASYCIAATKCVDKSIENIIAAIKALNYENVETDAVHNIVHPVSLLEEPSQIYKQIDQLAQGQLSCTV